MMKSASTTGQPASTLIDERIAGLGDWRGAALARMRKLILEADAGVVEEWKWGGPVWSRDGILCTGETYKDKIKLTFAKGASLADPTKLFTSSLDGGTRRALDIFADKDVDGAAFKALVRAAVAANAKKAAPATTRGRLIGVDEVMRAFREGRRCRRNAGADRAGRRIR